MCDFGFDSACWFSLLLYLRQYVHVICVHQCTTYIRRGRRPLHDNYIHGEHEGLTCWSTTYSRVNSTTTSTQTTTAHQSTNNATLTLSLSPPFGLAAILLLNLPPSSRSKPNMAFCLQCVSNSEVGIIERLGKYTGLASPGLNCILWPIDVVSVRSSIRSRSKGSCTNLH